MPSGKVEAISPYQLPIVIAQFFGVKGESHIIGETYGRDLRCDFRFQNYASIDLLQNDVEELQGKAGKLTGTLKQTIATKEATYPESTFLGFQATGPAFLDGSDVHGWVQMGFLFWRQRKR